MKLPQIKRLRWNYLALAFFLPLVLMLILMMCAECAPFGSNSFMSSDAWHQYFPFFKAFRKAILSGESLLYTWTGMGMDYLGLIAYYLGSPLNLLSILVPENWLKELFNLLIPVKLSFASLFFAIFLKKLFHKDDLSLPLFGCFYGMCAWAMGYLWNTMWLDSFAVLPLVALGTVQLLRDKKFVLYTLSLFFAVVVNYYVGFFVCIFVLLLFICYEICRCKSALDLLKDFLRIAAFTLLGLGMTLFLTLPALGALTNSYASVNKFPDAFQLNTMTGEAVDAAKAAWKAYSAAKEQGAATFALWWEAFSQSIPPVLEGVKKFFGNMAGGISPTFKASTDLPNIYCGMGTALFAFLFFTCREVKLRDKLCSAFLLLFFLLSFLIRQLDYIWHGFHFPNEIPYRFSFLYSFVVLYMGYRAFLLRESFRPWQLLTAGGLYIALLLCHNDLSDPIFWCANGIFLFLYGSILVYTLWASRLPAPTAEEAEPEEQENALRQQETIRFHKKTAAFALAGVLGLELILNLVNSGARFPYAWIYGYQGYPQGSQIEEMADYMQQQDSSPFYRAEVTHGQTLNDGSLIGYNGISTFTSSANVQITKFMRTLGYKAQNNANRYQFEIGSPVSSLFLNLKYMIERHGNTVENPYFDAVHTMGNTTLLESNAYLPLGFLAESALGQVDFSQSGSNAFAFQNLLFSAATGLTGEVWELTPDNALTLEPGKTNVTGQTEAGYCSYQNGGSGTELTYSYAIDQTGYLCMDFTSSTALKFRVLKNGVQVLSEETSTMPCTMGICAVEPGDSVQVIFTCKANQKANVTVRSAVLQEDVFREGYEILNASTLQLREFSTTFVSGTVSCDRAGLLYTSIPQNGIRWSEERLALVQKFFPDAASTIGYWTVTVDGQETEPVLVGDAMLAVPLTSGEHTVSFSYHNPAFALGLTLSLCCLALFLMVIFFTRFYPQFRKKGKYQA